MKKRWIIIFLIIALILITGIVYYIWDNSESTIRSRIYSSYYTEISDESCVLNNYAGFISKMDCLDAIRCTSKKASEGIRKEDLNEFNKKIKTGQSIEVDVSAYFGNDFFNSCLSNYNSTLRSS